MMTDTATNKKPEKRSGASEMVALRNRFFYVYYRKLILVFVASLVVLGVAISLAVYFAMRTTPPIYLPITPDGKLIRTYPLNQASMDEASVKMMEGAVRQWAFDAGKKLFTYDYRNYSEQISEAQSFFTVRGWNSYLASFEKSNNLNAVQDMRMIVSFSPKGAPVITNQGVSEKEGRYSWKVEFPSEIQYVAHSGNKAGFTQTGVLHMVFIRVSTVDSPKGIGIDQIIFEETKLGAPKK